MKILAVSDQVDERIYSLRGQDPFRGAALILGCGDLPYTYLENLVSLLDVPLYYVPGNHDPNYNPGSPRAYAEGGTNLDRRSVYDRGLLLAGLGGSVRYRPDGSNQFSQGEAYRRAFRLYPRLLRNRIRYGRFLDILITHSPPFGIHDEDSAAHRGLRAINWLLLRARPRYHLHGHTHFYRQNLVPSVTRFGPTTIMNVYPYKVIEIEHV
jgi:Icc-related predicted phosphoesterase